MKKYLEDIKRGLLIWTSACIAFILTWALYSEWKEMKTVFNGDTLESVEWNKIVNNINELRTFSFTNFSTEEQWTWKYWIDWKKIYTKVLDFGAIPVQSSKTVPHWISNLSSFLPGTSLINYKPSTWEFYSIHSSSLSALTNNYQVVYDLNNIKITTWTNTTIWTSIWVLYYTCTDR